MISFADGAMEQFRLWGGQPNRMRTEEREVLRHLESEPGDGGVLAPAYLGSATPAFTGKPAWVGHPTWTPDFFEGRAIVADAIVSGKRLDLAQRTAYESGARYVLIACRDDQAGVEIALDDFVHRIRRFGCAAVFELRLPREF